MSRQITLTVGQSHNLSKGLIYEWAITYCGLVDDRICSIALRHSVAHNSEAFNLYLPTHGADFLVKKWNCRVVSANERQATIEVL
jgi:hypothetical protein